MFDNLEIYAPEWIEGCNQFTYDAYLPIELNGKHIGEVIVSKFDWAKAFHLNSRVSWLARDGNLLDRYKDYIFSKEENSITILPEMSEFFYTNQPILILSHIKISRNHHTMEVVDHLFETIVHSFLGQYSAMLIPNWQPIGKNLHISIDETMTFMHNHGITAIDEKMMFRYLDQMVYNELDIKDKDDTGNNIDFLEI